MNLPLVPASSTLRRVKGLAIILPILASLLAGITPAPAQPSATPRTAPIWYNCLTRERFTPTKQLWCRRWQTLQNATYLVPTDASEFKSVTLHNGRYQEDGLVVELVNQSGWLTFGDINGNGRIDAAVVLGVAPDPDGREIATYLTALLDVDQTAQAVKPLRLGERILLNGPITITNQQITVPFLTATEALDRFYGLEGAALRELPNSGNSSGNHKSSAQFPHYWLHYWLKFQQPIKLGR